jgi:hypothetical protein
MADVVLETRFPQTELITQALQLGTQLLFIFHRLIYREKEEKKKISSLLINHHQLHKKKNVRL